MWFSRVIETMDALHYPPCDIYETAQEITIIAELPGLSVKDLKLEIQDNILTVSGEKNKIFLSEGKWHLSERMMTPFKRSFALAKQVDPGFICANFKDGLLKITIIKKEVNPSKPIQIEVA